MSITLPSDNASGVYAQDQLYTKAQVCSGLQKWDEHQGQGLVMEATLKAGDSYKRQLETVYRQARRWQQRFAAREKNLLSTPCSSKTGALCSGDSSSLEQEIILRLAAAPAAYDTRTFPGFPRPRLNQPFNQDTCSLCVSAAVTAAAEAAVASVLKIPAGQVQLSKTFLHYCTAGNEAEEKPCTSGWKIEDALNALQKALSIPDVKCHPNPGTSFIAAGQLPPCPNLDANQLSCKQTFADQGEFTYTKIKTFLEAQDWIRQFGAVVTSMILVKDGSPNEYHLRTFYEKNAKTVPYRAIGAPSNAGTEGHALLLVGYDNEKEQWIAQNSWGPKFADQGYFRIPYNESSIAPLEMMFDFTQLIYPRPTPLGAYPAREKTDTWQRGELQKEVFRSLKPFDDEIGLATNKDRSFRLGKGGPNLTVMKIPNKACLAAVSGYVSKWFAGSNDRDGRSYDQVAGLQFDWTYKC
eukprot:gene2512-2817_t